MATIVKVPALGAAIANVTIVRWLVAEGAEVHRGEALLEVETDKMNMEIPAERDGILQRILADPGTTQREGDPLAIIADAGEKPSEVTAYDQVAADRDVPVLAGAPPTVATPAAPQRIVATPVARRVAKELGVDLTHVHSTRPTITEDDVRRYQAAGDDEVEVIPLVGARKVIADRMAESFRTIPHYSMTLEVDCTRLVALRTQLQRSAGGRLTYTAFMVKAIALAVRDEPIANATLVDDEIRVSKTASVGVAVAAGNIIVVPVVRNPIRSTVLEIGHQLARLTELGRERRLAPADVAGATITLSNVGGTEIASANTIISPPQVAMIAVTRIAQRVTPIDGMIAVRPWLNASFTYDHRVVQGVPGARFAERVKYYIEHPDELDS